MCEKTPKICDYQSNLVAQSSSLTQHPSALCRFISFASSIVLSSDMATTCSIVSPWSLTQLLLYILSRNRDVGILVTI